MTTLDQLQNLLVQYGPIVAVITILLVLALLIRKNWPTISGTVKVVDLLVGLDKRLKSMQDTQKDHGERLISVEKELKPNGGSSMRDVVDGMKKQLDQHIEASEQTERVRVSDRAEGTAEGVDHHNR